VLATLVALSTPAPAPALADTLPAQATLTVGVDDAATGQAWQSPESANSSAVAAAALAPAGTTPASGSVTYSLYGNALCVSPAISSQTVQLNGDGTVPDSSATGALSDGAYAFEATYSGDAGNAAAATSCVAFAVGRPQAVTPSASAIPTSASYGNTVILSVAGLPSDATGSVTFATATANLCSATVSLGAASCTTALLPAGGYAVTAVYSGDAAYQPADAAAAFTITPSPAAAFQFVAPPSVEILQPVNAAHYTRRETVRANYSCADGAEAAGLVLCLGSVATGTPIDTNRLGEHTFTVIGVSHGGESTIRTLHYLVDMPGNRIAVPQPDLRADGTGTVRVWVPGPGKLSALETAWRANRPEPRVGHQTVLSRGSVSVGRAGRVTVSVRPVASGRGLLHRSRGQRLRVQLSVSYTPTGGDVRQLSKYGLLRIR
jgi:hypothetical protein